MGRALAVVALLIACPAAARADGTDDAVAALVGMIDHCQEGLDYADVLLEAGDLGDDERTQVENERSFLEILCPMMSDDARLAQETLEAARACTNDCDVETAMYLVLGKGQADAQAVFAAMKALQAIGNGESVATDEPSDGPHTISLSTIGVSIEVPSTWDVHAGDDADLIAEDGVDIAAVFLRGEDDCASTVDGVAQGADDHSDITISLPYAWSGVEFSRDGSWSALFCREGDPRLIVSASSDVAAVVIAGIEAALSSSGGDGTSYDEPYVGSDPSPDPDPRPEAPRRRTVIGGLMPRTLQLGLVRRADEMGSGFGFGLQLGRLGWREGYRFTIGYEAAAAATTGFWNLSAQVRPGFSPMISDLPVDAYVAVGVDAIGGDRQAETDVAPVGGVGAEVLFTLPGLGADLAAQVLADPGGLHSYLLHGGLLFGGDGARIRLGTSYVRYADDSSTLWFTLGFTALELR